MSMYELATAVKYRLPVIQQEPNLFLEKLKR